MSMTNAFHHRLLDLLGYITFQDWKIQHFEDGEGSERLYLQVSADGTCARTGGTYRWKGRKWFLSPHMTDSEIVMTAFKAVLTAQEHETREAFLYKGQPVCGPHLDVNKLAELCRANAYDTRPDPRDTRPDPRDRSGHGHVFPLPSGTKARCGGPSYCPQCKADQHILNGGVGH